MPSSRSFRCRLPENSPSRAQSDGTRIHRRVDDSDHACFWRRPGAGNCREPTGGLNLSRGRWGGATLTRRGGQIFICIEVALALVLLCGAGLMIQSFARLLAVDRGFQADHIVTFAVEPVDRSAAVARAVLSRAHEALRITPGVAAVGAIEQRALNGGRTYYFPKTDNGASFAGPQRNDRAGVFRGARRARDSRTSAREERRRRWRGLPSSAPTRPIGFSGGAAIGHTLSTDGARGTTVSHRRRLCPTSDSVIPLSTCSRKCTFLPSRVASDDYPSFPMVVATRQRLRPRGGAVERVAWRSGRRS